MLKLIVISVLVALVASQRDRDPNNLERFFSLPLDIGVDEQKQSRQLDVSYRLPNATVPEKYEIYLTTNIHKAEFKFTGTVEITLRAVENTREIVIHQRQLTIISTILETTTGTPTNVNLDGDPTYDSVTEFLTIKTVNELTSDTRYKLIIEYEGDLRTDMGGFYRSSYKNANDETVWLATTQFESTDARHGFPCYDEPALKAEFVFHITHDPSYTAITNFNQISNVSNVDGSVMTTFEWDGEGEIKMSTYLVAFIISDYSYIENQAAQGKLPQRVFSRPQFIEDDQGHFALEAGEKILDKIAQVLKTPYTLNKMDQISIPDFSAGAMENWGLVTYRDVYLMYKEGKSTYVNKFNVATIIAHEFGHQWFGNLVSPKWWTYLWLNEGFATYFESYATELVYPDWRVMDLLLINDVQNSLLSDAQTSAVPMTHYVEDPNSISGRFSYVVYAKGGSVIRMMEHMMGSEKFFEGLKDYLASRQMKEATEDHLFDVLSTVAKTGDAFPKDFDLKEVMYSWTQQAGFPLVTVQRNYENNSITFHQERFFTTKPTEKDTTTYYIPYNLATVADAANPSTAPLGFIPKGMTEFLISPDDSYSWKSDEWIIVNNKQTGYYRVNYDEENWKMVTEQLMSDPSKINIQNKAQLLDDAFNLARAGDIEYDIPLNLAAYLTKETDYIPWIAAINGLNALNTRILGTSNYHLFQKYYASLIEPYFKHLGLEDKPTEPFIDKFGRTIAIRTACAMGVNECQTAAYNYLDNAINSGEDVHPNLQSAIYCAGLRSSSDALVTGVFDKMTNTDDSNEKSLLVTALGCSLNASHLHHLLQLSAGQGVSGMDETVSIITSVYTGSHIGIEVTIDFLNDDENVSIFTGFAPSMSSILNGISQRIFSESYQEKFKNLVQFIVDKEMITESTATSLNNRVTENINWYNSYSPALNKFLEDFDKDDEDDSASTAFISVTLIVSALLLQYMVRQ